VVPVVFHLIGSHCASLTDSQVIAALDRLNFDMTSANGTDTNKLNAKIKFCLAKKNKDGIAIAGIDRFTGNANNGLSYDTLSNYLLTSTGTQVYDPLI
jgi:hypothetical protein